MTSTTNLFLVDDHPILLSSLETLLKGVSDVQVIGAAQNGIELLETLQEMKRIRAQQEVDIIVMDIAMEPLDGWETTRKVKTDYPEIKIIMFSSHDHFQDVQKSLLYGADGFLSKNLFSIEALQKGIREVQLGNQFLIYPDEEQEKGEVVSTESISFTRREIQIIRLICQNLDQEAIASHLQLSPLTIATYLKNIRNQLNVKTNEGIIQETLNFRFDE